MVAYLLSKQIYQNLLCDAILMFDNLATPINIILKTLWLCVKFYFKSKLIINFAL